MFAYYLIVKHDKALLQLSEILRHCQMMIESHVFTQNLLGKPLGTYSETITASPCPSGMIA